MYYVASDRARESAGSERYCTVRSNESPVLEKLQYCSLQSHPDIIISLLYDDRDHQFRDPRHGSTSGNVERSDSNSQSDRATVREPSKQEHRPRLLLCVHLAVHEFGSRRTQHDLYHRTWERH